MAPERYLLASIQETEDGWQERRARVEKKYQEALRRVSSRIPAVQAGVCVGFGGAPGTWYFSTDSAAVRDEFVAQGAEPETDTR